jgi:tetratricopeptide (TPR) repeat protein
MQQYGSARVTRVSESEAIAVAGGLYQPIRRTLDVRAFGVNAYFARTAGDQLIEEHDETGTGAGGHAELYIVLSGRASFRVDGDEIDAPAGTIVFLPDPASKRHAIAMEAGTSALVIGGPADRNLPVSPFEFWFRAEEPYRAGDYAQAIEIVSSGLEEYPEHPHMLYQLACYHALAGDHEQALDHFERACSGSAKPKEWQEGDTDLDLIRDDSRFAAAISA